MIKEKRKMQRKWQQTRVPQYKYTFILSFPNRSTIYKYTILQISNLYSTLNNEMLQVFLSHATTSLQKRHLLFSHESL